MAAGRRGVGLSLLCGPALGGDFSAQFTARLKRTDPLTWADSTSDIVKTSRL